MFKGKVSYDIVGTGQGSIISPILANIYLNELDVFMEDLKNKFSKMTMKTKVNKEYQQIRHNITKARNIEDQQVRRKTIQLLASQLRRTPYKIPGIHNRNLKYIRYADD